MEVLSPYVLTWIKDLVECSTQCTKDLVEFVTAVIHLRRNGWHLMCKIPQNEPGKCILRSNLKQL